MLRILEHIAAAGFVLVLIDAGLKKFQNWKDRRDWQKYREEEALRQGVVAR